jgi:dTDP-4-amino-4,6-dideoxygalactose transaminase
VTAGPGRAEDSARIPLSRVRSGPREAAYVAQAIESGILAGPGPFSAACEKLIAAQTGSRATHLVPSCTAALEMSAHLLGLGAGDEVIMPSFTFVSTANAVVLRGAVPVFADVDPVTFNLDPAAVEAAITPCTRAIFATHYAGVPADMGRLMEIAARQRIAVVEDAAQAYGSTRDGRPAGSFAPLACFSFHGTKNLTAGEAGALAINDPVHLAQAAVLRDKGTDRARFLAGEVDRYSWQAAGSSQIVSELVAAFLLGQLESAEEVLAERLALWQAYRGALADAAAAGHFVLPAPPDTVNHNAHIFFLVLPDRAARAALAGHLAGLGITASTHYVPLHSAPAGQRFGRAAGPLEQTRRAADCLLRLPLYRGLGADQGRVIAAVLDWTKGR